MNKIEFLQKLEQGLAAATVDERVAAMQYYTEYLDEAGPEKEEAVIEELGGPEKVVADILGTQSAEGWTPPTANTAAGAEKSGSPFDEDAPKAPPPPDSWVDGARHVAHGLIDNVSDAIGKIGQPKDEAAQQPPPGPQAPPQGTYPPPPHPYAESQAPAAAGQYNQNNSRVAKIILGILICIFVFPILGGLGGVLAGVIISLIVVFFIPFILGVAFIPAGIVIFICSILLLPVSVGSGLMAMGVGVLLVGLGLLCFYGGTRLLGRTLPAIFRTVFGWLRHILNSVTGFFRK